MKVYTHFYNVGKDSFRWRTLLQCGDSWNIIGTVVMKNPGTAAPKSIVDDSKTLSNLSKFDKSNDDWYEFSADSTMNCVGELLAFYYDKHSSKELNGIIQIFNLFYLKDENLLSALKKDKYSSWCRFGSGQEMLAYDIKNLRMPIYLGFADLAFKKKYSESAECFFNEAKKLGMNYCCPEFNCNKFIHPQYLMLFGKNKDECVRVKNCFKNNSCA